MRFAAPTSTVPGLCATCIQRTLYIWTRRPLTWRPMPIPWSVVGSVRGAKTRTVVKASSLPQGALPPLPQDEADRTPAKSYPTVLQQHLNNVRKYKDCVVLTRVGDFYEMYFDQVEQYAPLLNLKKAKRATSLGEVPMAGFQQSQLDRYLKMLVQDLGKQVAISEQIRLPETERLAKAGAPMYDRKVSRIITAGTLIDENFMDPFENNYLLAVYFDGAIPDANKPGSSMPVTERYQWTTKVGLSWVDLSSGDFFTQVSDLATLPSIIARIGPREIVLDGSSEQVGALQVQKLLGDGAFSLHFQPSFKLASSVAEWAPMLERAVSEKDAEGFTPAELAAGSLLVGYVGTHLMDTTIHLQPPQRHSDEEYLAIDKQSLRGLEVRSTLRDNTFQGSLLHAFRQTVTKSGARLLSQRLVSPSMSLRVINDRLDLVQEMLSFDALREDIIVLLRRTADTRRLLQRFSIGRGDADELLSLAQTIEVMDRIAEVLHEHIIAQQDRQVIDGHESARPHKLGFLRDVMARLDLQGPSKVAESIKEAIDEEGLNRQNLAEAEQQEQTESMAAEVEAADQDGEKAPRLSRRSATKPSRRAEADSGDIWIMKKNASATLARAHEDLAKLFALKADLLKKARQQLQTESLTLKWSAQLGHFCHIKGRDAKVNLSALPGARVIGSTKSTRSFYLSDWTSLGIRIDDFKLRIRAEEERVFGKLRVKIIENLAKLRRNASALDELDVACSSAVIAKQRSLVRPILNETTQHRVIGGRHPTVDIGLTESGRVFTANDCSVGGNERIYLITGPNMAGKSTYLRQNALITILAQTGCFVPADHAEIGLVDKIFSRVGSADNLYQDQSTFMVEMLETAEILKQATPRSFVVMDEVGRGTTPEDGIAVGYACLYNLHNVNRCRALFATHFHALADMTRDFDHLARYCTDVAEEHDGSWSYIHKLRPGVNRASHALKVARLAGMPESAIGVAADVLRNLQQAGTSSSSHHIRQVDGQLQSLAAAPG